MSGGDDLGAATLVRRAYERFTAGDLEGLLEQVDSDLEWTYLDPSESDPEPRVCHGRGEFERALKRRSSSGLKTELEEVIGVGDRVVVVTRMPGLDGVRARQAVDRNFDVVTVRSERLVSIRACHDLAEAMAMLGSSLEQ